jgi:putative transposase
MRDVCTGLGAELREFNGEDDHVHLPVHHPPTLAISTLGQLPQKRVSSHHLRKDFTGRVNQHIMHGHLWSPSYLAASRDGASS